MSEATIHQRLIAIMADVPAIPKGQRNKQQGYEFRGIDDVYAALHPLFVKHGVVVLPEVLAADYAQRENARGTLMTDARLLIRYTFAAPDGSTASITVQGESRDAADKATNQAMSSAIKYGLLQAFLIPVDEMPDADRQTLEVVASPDVRAKQAVFEAVGTQERAKEMWKRILTNAKIEEPISEEEADFIIDQIPSYV